MSEFWRRKMKTYYHRLDSNHNGVLEKEDFEMIIDRFKEMENATPERAELYEEKLIIFYDKISNPAGDKTTPTVEELTEAIHSQIKDEAFAKALEELCNITFIILDGDGDGYIKKEEYVRFFYNISIPDYESMGKFVFEALDIDHDGKLTMDEFRSAIFDFFYSEDETCPGTLWIGPLM